MSPCQAGVGRAPQATGSSWRARGWQARFPGFKYHLNQANQAQAGLGRLFPGFATGCSTAGEPIPELARHGLQQLIVMEVAAVLDADRRELSEERLGYRNVNWSRILTTQLGDIDLLILLERRSSAAGQLLRSRLRLLVKSQMFRMNTDATASRMGVV